ncbi:hypothetical protein SDC9_184041 [bioreactor metagenome]|uniref:Uncharacterized protein n=1 Tax=bioreactor metagenome TaxID=1076179 RepID=A0A645HDU3_9ZZZZ
MQDKTSKPVIKPDNCAKAATQKPAENKQKKPEKKGK